MEFFVILATWVLLGWLIHTMATKRNRNAWGWALGSVLLSPLVGIILLLLLGEKVEEVDHSV